MFFTLATQWLLLLLALLLGVLTGWWFAKRRCTCGHTELDAEVASLRSQLDAEKRRVASSGTVSASTTGAVGGAVAGAAAGKKAGASAPAATAGNAAKLAASTEAAADTATGNAAKTAAGSEASQAANTAAGHASAGTANVAAAGGAGLLAGGAAAVAATAAAESRLKGEITDLQAEVASVRAERDELAKRARLLASDDESDKKRISDLEAEVAKHRTEVEAVRAELEGATKKSDALAADDESDKAAIERLSAELRQLRAAQAGDAKRIQGFSSQADTDRFRIDGLEKAAAAAAAGAAATLAATTARHRSELEAREAELAALRSQSSTLAADDASDKAKIERLSAAVRDLEAGKAADERRIETLSSQARTHLDRVTVLEREAAEATAGAANAAKTRDDKHRTELEALAAQLASLRTSNAAELRRSAALSADDASEKAKIDTLTARVLELESESAERSRRMVGFAALPDAPPAPDLTGAKSILGIDVAADDLRCVEGIGPKIDEVLRSAGITTWWGLAYTSTERIRDILDGAGPAYRIADPTTWPRQAKLLAQGRWEEAASLRSVLRAGRR